jgi:hypothetical protein
MKKLLLPLAAAVAAVLPATAGAASFGGVVVAKQPARHAVVVSAAGVVRTVHTHRLGLAVGTRVAVKARLLADGTFSATSVVTRGRAKTARIRGVVARQLKTGYLVAAGHSMLAVRTRRLADANAPSTGPATGTIVDVTVDTNDTELDQQEVSEHGHAQRVELEGTVASITPATASDPGELVLTVGKSTINVVLPAGTTLPSALAVGDKVELKATLAGDTFTLATSHEEGDDQGDDGGHGGGDHHGGDHQGGGGDG